MKPRCLIAILSILHFSFSILNSSAAVPLRWTVETSRLQPAVFDVVRGETLALEATFQSYGTPVSTSNMTAFLCWQTNGMSSAWWVTNAVTSVNSASVLFTPSMDPGAQTVNAFIGLSSTNYQPTANNQQPTTSYRAAITLRFRHGPGAAPNVIDMPPRILDLAHTVVVNPPWPTTQDFAATTTVMKAELKTYVDSEISGAGLVTPTMTTNIATDVVQRDVADWAAKGNELPQLVYNGVYENASYDGFVDFKLWVCRSRIYSPSKVKVKFLPSVGEVVEGEFAFPFSINGAFTIYKSNGFVNVMTTGYIYTIPDDLFKMMDGKMIHPSEFIKYTIESIPSWARNANKPSYTAEEVTGAQTASDVNNAIANSGHLTSEHAYDLFVPRSLKINGQPLSNDVTIAAGVTSVNTKTGDVTLDASDVGAYPATSGQQLASQVATQGAHMNAEDAKFVVTNYDSQVNIPDAEVKIKLQQGGTNVWRTIWKEMRRWNAFCGVGFDWQNWCGFHTWSTNVMAIINETSPKEYAFYDGVTGDVAPDGFFWISQPRISICAGAAYQRYIDAGGAVWILESNGLVANMGGTTNGYFRISDEEGNTQFEIIKGDKQTVPSTARSMRRETVLGVTHWFCDYAVTNAVSPPVAKFCRNLGANPPVWYDDTDASCPCNVEWTLTNPTTYTLEFWPKSNEPLMFCKAEYDRGGETRIRQSVPTEMQYVILNGTKYGLVPKTVNGELVMGLTTGN